MLQWECINLKGFLKAARFGALLLGLGNRVAAQVGVC